MALWNITVDDTSPILQYSSGGYNWQHKTGPTDEWYNGTYNYANSFDPYSPSVQMNFSGSAVTIYGTTTQGYRITLDDGGPGQVYQPENSTGILYSNTNLTMGFHTVWFGASNSTPNAALDLYIDRFVVGAQVGAEGANLTESYIRPQSDALQTFGKIQKIDLGRNGSTPFAVDENAGFAFNFTGSAVAVYSPPYVDGVMPVRAQYSVYLNSSVPPKESDTRWITLPGQTNGNGELQFFATGLPEGEHRVAIVSVIGGGQGFGFDYAQVITPSEYLPQSNAICYNNCSEVSNDQTGPGYNPPAQSFPIQQMGGAAKLHVLGGIGILGLAGMLIVSLL